MGIKTKISYVDSTINPIMGCTGCALRKEHCYAAFLCTRYAGHKGWPKSFDNPEFFPGRLERAMRWKDLRGSIRPDKPWLNDRPRLVFVNNLSDGFCPDVDPFGWLWPHLEELETSPHIYLLLTKWPQRMREFFISVGYVPSNLWLGVSAENQAAADGRIPVLQRIPAEVRFVSLEPLLGGINLLPWLRPYPNCGNVAEDGTCASELNPTPECHVAICPTTDVQGISWVICGGESGSGARPMHPQWARDIRAQCQAAGIPYFHKQNGEYIPADGWNQWGTSLDGGFVGRGKVRAVRTIPEGDIYDVIHMVRVGKKRAGFLLDGKEWREFPNVG